MRDLAKQRSSSISRPKEDLFNGYFCILLFQDFSVAFFEELLALETTEEKVHYLVQNRMAYLKTNRDFDENYSSGKIFSNKKLRKEQLYIWNTLQDKLLVLHKELIADSRVNPEITVPQMVRICIGPLLAYFAQLYIVSDNSDIREEDLNLLEKQILGGLWK